MKRLTTRSRATAEAIRDREDFRTSGALMGEEVGGMGRYDSGRLAGADLDQFYLDLNFIDYVVLSYSTPIAWHFNTGSNEGWYVVNQRFSLTTTKHQSNLYLIPREGEAQIKVLTNEEQIRMCLPPTIGGVARQAGA